MYNSSSKVFNIRERTFRFGVTIVKLLRSLPKDTAGFSIGGQVIRSGTGVGANVEEAQNCGSRKEFVRSMTIALKEARETEYWLKIILETGLIAKSRLEPILEEVREIIRVLTTIVKRTKENAGK